MKRKTWCAVLLTLTIAACDDDDEPAGGDGGPPPQPDGGVPPGPDAGGGGRTEVAPTIQQLTPEMIPAGTRTAPETLLTLFYPGQVSYHWLRGGTQPGATGTHAGAAGVEAGLACRSCHVEGGAARPPSELGASIPTSLDLAPIPQKPPTVDVSLRFTYDDQYLYTIASWEGDAEPGDVHEVFRYDAATGEWVVFGGPRQPTADPPIYEDRFTFLFGHARGEPGYVTGDDGVAYGFQEHGCFITCHNSMRSMPRDVAGDPRIGELFPNQSDIRKYLLITREGAEMGDPAAGLGVTEEEGRWSLLKPAGQLTALKAEGKILDHFHWRAARSNPIGYSDDTFVFDYRRGDMGAAAWIGMSEASLNMAAAGMNPGNAYMFNPAVVTSRELNGGTYAIAGGADPLAALEAAATRHVMATLDMSAIPYDSSVYTAQDNDILIADVLQQPDGSHADILADGRWTLDPATGRGRWTVVLRRALVTGNPDDIDLEEGKIYPIGFSVHDDNVTVRYHWVSMEYTLGIGTGAGEADITATRLP